MFEVCLFTVMNLSILSFLFFFFLSVSSYDRLVTYHGGRVLTGNTTMYLIFYGDDWLTGKDRIDELVYFWNNIGYTSAWSGTRFFFDNNNDFHQNIRIGNYIIAPYLYSNNTAVLNLTPTNVTDVISAYITNKTLPYNNNSIYYFVGDRFTNYCAVKENVGTVCFGGSTKFCNDYGKASFSMGTFLWGASIEFWDPNNLNAGFKNCGLTTSNFNLVYPQQMIPWPPGINSNN